MRCEGKGDESSHDVAHFPSAVYRDVECLGSRCECVVALYYYTVSNAYTRGVGSIWKCLLKATESGMETAHGQQSGVCESVTVPTTKRHFFLHTTLYPVRRASPAPFRKATPSVPLLLDLTQVAGEES